MTDKPLAACVCGEINTRHCPEHGQLDCREDVRVLWHLWFRQGWRDTLWLLAHRRPWRIDWWRTLVGICPYCGSRDCVD